MALLLLFHCAALAQPSPRKRLGIALAGGGAKGLAHVGVLQWMEERRIPIDAVAGTSMGGLVGGLYATGRSTKEIQAFVREIRWEHVFRAGPDYSDLSYRRKEDQRAYPSTFDLGLRGGRLRLPSGVNPGHQVELLLERISADYGVEQSFDQLPTPFRCVATDLRSGEAVVFADGSLPLALRATMSLPALFAPISYRKKLLVDGGVVNNLPTEVVKDMKVDVVVAVDLGFPLISPGDTISLLEVANRSIDILIRRRTLESLKLADIVLSPKVLEVATLGFDQVDHIIQLGYEAAAAAESQLMPYQLNEAAWAEYLAERRSRRPNSLLTPAFIELTGEHPADHNRLLTQFRQFIGRPLNRDELELELNRVAGLGPYAAARYEMVEREGRKGIEIQLRRKMYGPPFVRPLLLLDGGSSVTLAARMVAFNFLTRNSELRTDVSVGRLNSAAAEFYQFLGPKGFFVAPRAFAYRDRQIIVEEGARLADYRIRRAGGGIDAGYNFGRLHEIRAGVEFTSIRASTEIGLPSYPDVSGAEQFLNARWRMNDLNRNTIPTKGLLIETDWTWSLRAPTVNIIGEQPGSRGRYAQAFGQLLHATPIGERWSALLRLAGGSTVVGEAPQFSLFRLGGPLRLSALDVGEARGAHFGYGSALLLRQLHSSSAPGLGKIYGMLGYEAGNAFNSRLNLFHSGVAGIMAETGIGVVSLGIGYGEYGRRSLVISVGRAFDSNVRSPLQIR